MGVTSSVNVIGPIMIGPSSSHTAGAVKIGLVARRFAEGKFNRVVFGLHGSFAETYRGHGTDRALLAGVMGIQVDDIKVRDAYSLADEQGLEYEIEKTNLGNYHANAVRIQIFQDDDKVVSLIGESLGGGQINIAAVNGVDLEVSMEMPTLIVVHVDRVGVVARLSNVLSEAQINIATLKVYRKSRGSEAYTIIETDQSVDAGLKERIINEVPSVKRLYAV